MPRKGGERPRLLLLLPSTTYRAEAFIKAADRLDVDVTVASDKGSALSERQPAELMTLDFFDPRAAAARICDFAREHPIAAVFGVDDDTAVIAAAIAEALGLPGNPLSAAEAARDKYLQRVVLKREGILVPGFSLHGLSEDPRRIASRAAFPCVLKPVSLSASRGVIRADSVSGFENAHSRLLSILRSPDVAPRGEGAQRFLVEDFVSGPEFALEGLLIDGRLHVLAVFDKPDALEGPFFEETIYVTPPRLPGHAQRALAECAERAALALGLGRGPIHAELRYNDRGPWLIELAARPIGGKCGQVLRFGADGTVSLEEIVLAQALGNEAPPPPRETTAAGVMMIPTPRIGVFREVRGIEEASSVPGVTDVLITVHRGQELVPLPEGSRYLGFILARARTAEDVEAALRRAHGCLEIVVED